MRSGAAGKRSTCTAYQVIRNPQPVYRIDEARTSKSRFHIRTSPRPPAPCKLFQEVLYNHRSRGEVLGLPMPNQLGGRASRIRAGPWFSKRRPSRRVSRTSAWANRGTIGRTSPSRPISMPLAPSMLESRRITNASRSSEYRKPRVEPLIMTGGSSMRRGVIPLQINVPSSGPDITNMAHAPSPPSAAAATVGSLHCFGPIGLARTVAEPISRTACVVKSTPSNVTRVVAGNTRIPSSESPVGVGAPWTTTTASRSSAVKPTNSERRWLSSPIGIRMSRDDPKVAMRSSERSGWVRFDLIQHHRSDRGVGRPGMKSLPIRPVSRPLARSTRRTRSNERCTIKRRARGHPGHIACRCGCGQGSTPAFAGTTPDASRQHTSGAATPTSMQTGASRRTLERPGIASF